MGNKKNQRRIKHKATRKVFKGNQYVDGYGPSRTEAESTTRGSQRSGPPPRPTKVPHVNEDGTPAKRPKICIENRQADRNDFNFIMNFQLLKNMVEKFCKCPMCSGNFEMKVNNAKKAGLAVNIEISCFMCQWKEEFFSSEEIESSGTPGKTDFEINYRCIIGFREIGRGLDALQTFCQFANLTPPMTRKNYDNINEKLLGAYKSAAADSMLRECENIRAGKNQNAVVDAMVAIDGTWQKRGYSSLNGVVVATSTNGKVVDLHVMSKFCKACELWERKKGTNEFEEWKAGHCCKINHKASSGAMEAAGAVEIFKRSVERSKLQFTQYIGDGDTEAFGKVIESCPYGPDVIIEKLECVGHIQKRLGTRLRKLRSALKGKVLSDGKSIGGRGRLTDVAINTLQNYFGMAIRQNIGDLYGMKKAIGAVLYHCCNVNEEVRHRFCPRTENSWCKWQLDQINKTKKYKARLVFHLLSKQR